MKRGIFSLVSLLGLVLIALGLNAAVVLAAPELGVSLERDEAEFPTVFHSDERVDFTVKVKNLAPKTESVSSGTVLTCEGGNWGREDSSGFALSFEWLSNAIPASGPALQTGPRTGTYEVQAADEGHALQCLVKAENDGSANSAASLPILVGSLSPAPPTYSGPGRPQPGISQTTLSATEMEFSCTEPISGVWAGSPAWSYQWLRNGVPIAGASDSTYIAHTGAGEEDHLVGIQCEVKGDNAGGAVVMMSNVGGETGPSEEFNAEFGVPGPPINGFALTDLPLIADSNRTNAPVTLELELPAGDETFAFKTEPSSWTCDRLPASGAQPARAVCSREDLLPPQDEFPTLKVITSLGADAPDIATAEVTVFGGGAGIARDELTFPIEPAIPFGISEFTAKLLDEDETTDYTQAGGHPFEGFSSVVFNQKRGLESPTSIERVPVAKVRQVIADIPRGVVGNQLALPALCPGVEQVAEAKCPPESAVGMIHIEEGGNAFNYRIHAIEPEFGVPAQFAFADLIQNIYSFSARLRPEDGYAVSLELAPAPESVFLTGSTVTLCDFGANISASGGFLGCFKKDEPGANPKPLFTNPTRCGVPLTTRIRLNSWSDPTFVEGPPFPNAEITGCDAVPFEPEADLQPTNRQADSPTGMDVEVSMPTEGLEDPEGISQSNLREAKVTFPEGMAINPSAGQGLGACSKEQIALGTNNPITCPDSSKIGSVEIDTPVIEDSLKGDVYIAKQGEIEGSLIGFYLVFDSPKDGILVKLPAKVSPDPQTGQLTVTVAESPEQPFSAVRMHFPGGPRATLLTPPKCGKYAIKSELVPWSGGAPVTINSPFEVNQGPNGGPCPSGGLDATLSAGSENPLAGQTTPFNVRLTRPDGSDRFAALGLHLPPGLTAYLKGIPYCPQSAIEQAESRSATGQGQTEIDNPSCPAASKIGAVVAGAGAGESPLYVDTGKAYLAGPYKGAPLSIVAIAPAVAGPLDLGTVVVRNALKINPRTAEVDVVSDPIPTILHGVLLDIRDVRVLIDRPSFTLNPSDCEAKQVGATVSGLSGASAELANRFQVGGCENLGFKPNLKTRLFGGTHRGDFPRFKATYKPRSGDSNLEDLLLRFPRSEFIEQGHFRTICTRVQYAAGAGLGSECPKGSIYGHIEASTPLLSEPLSGPVYLRSSDHNLPDVVFALHGQVDAEAAVRIDSVKGGLRASLEDAPDVPLTKVVLNMAGKDKGLFVNSRDICAQANKATLKASAHNGREFEAKPVLKNPKCGKARKHKRRHKRAQR